MRVFSTVVSWSNENNGVLKANNISGECARQIQAHQVSSWFNRIKVLLTYHGSLIADFDNRFILP